MAADPRADLAERPRFDRRPGVIRARLAGFSGEPDHAGQLDGQDVIGGSGVEDEPGRHLPTTTSIIGAWLRWSPTSKVMGVSTRIRIGISRGELARPAGLEPTTFRSAT